MSGAKGARVEGGVRCLLRGGAHSLQISYFRSKQQFRVAGILKEADERACGPVARGMRWRGWKGFIARGAIGRIKIRPYYCLAKS